MIVAKESQVLKAIILLTLARKALENSEKSSYEKLAKTPLHSFEMYTQSVENHNKIFYTVQ